MMTAPRTLPFAGTDEELDRYLLEFAQLARGWAAKHAADGSRTLSGGARLSTNPNTIPWRVRVRRQADGLVLAAEAPALPWTRAKVTRIAAYREGQLADYLTARVRGSGPEKFDADRLQEPFSAWGSGVAALTSSFSWAVLTGVAAFVVAFVAAILASLPLMGQAIREIAAHSDALLAAGAVPLPSPAEAAATSPLGAAVIFALPIAFFSALVHGLALIACDVGFRTSRAPQASFLFQVILIAMGFFPFLPALALPLAILIPAGAHLGASLVWSRRRERGREGPRPAKALIVIAVALAASLAGSVAPRPTEWKESLVRIALFRDTWLLGNPLGKAIASTYYRYTLYTAEPIKELYSTDDHRARRGQPIAQCEDPKVAALLRVLHFTVVHPGKPSDLVAPLGAASLEALAKDLDQASRARFRGGPLRELCAVAWHTLYYAGPLAALLLFMGLLSPFVSVLFRKLKPKTAILALSGCAIVTSLTLVLIAGGEQPGKEVNDLAEDLADAREAVRHEAAVRAAGLDSTAPLAEALLKAVDDPDYTVKLWACAALGKSGDPRALAKLVERLADPEIHVRYRAAEGLGFLKDPRAVEPLLAMMRERSWYEGAYALDALRRIQPGVR